MRLNGVKEIKRHLGVLSDHTFRRLKRLGMPLYRDPESDQRVWALTDELDAWDRERCCQPRGPGAPEWPGGSRR